MPDSDVSRAERSPREGSEILLVCVIVARSGSFLLSKVALRSMAPLDLLSVRFIAAFALLAALFWRKLARASAGAVGCGLLLGGVFTATMGCELMGLRASDSSRVAFLENSAFVFVPVYEAVLARRPPGARTVACVLITVAGIGCLTLKNGLSGFSAGDLFGVAAAMLYASAIVVTDRLARRFDALTVGVIQVGGMALFSTLAAAAAGGPRLPPSAREWVCAAVLAVVCTGFGFTLQPVAQRGATAERAGMLCALAPVSAGFLGRVALGERLGARGLLGAALVMTGILAPRLFGARAGRGGNAGGDG